LSKEVKGQDIYLPLSGLRTHGEGIEALWQWCTENWDALVVKLPPGLSMLGSVVSICTASFTKKEQAEKVKEFYKSKSTKGFDQALAQSLDAISAKTSWIERDGEDVKTWLQKNGYL
jgi:aminopeptidase 2